MPDTFTDTIYSGVLKDNNINASWFNIRKIIQAFFKATERQAIVIPEKLIFDFSKDKIYKEMKKLILDLLCQEKAIAPCL